MFKVLVLAPHADDAEIGCGGTMARFIEQEAELSVVVFSTAEDSLPEGAPKDLLVREFHAAMDVLGLPDDRRLVYKYRVRRMHEVRQEVLDTCIQLQDIFDPDIVFIPSGHDVHQDHQVLYMEGLRAFRDCSIYGYELPRNHLEFHNQGFACLEDRHLSVKLEMLKCYKSQHDLCRPYFSPDFIVSLARVRGVQVGSQFAEAFEVYRSIL